VAEGRCLEVGELNVGGALRAAMRPAGDWEKTRIAAGDCASHIEERIAAGDCSSHI
jgi:DNA-binding transcriptional regulator YdaS (Cro superfamily)